MCSVRDTRRVRDMQKRIILLRALCTCIELAKKKLRFARVRWSILGGSTQKRVHTSPGEGSESLVMEMTHREQV